MSTGHGGTHGWKVFKEDDLRGLISAELKFTEDISGQESAVSRTITANFVLIPEGSSTKLETRYEVFSPVNNDTVVSIVKATQESLQNRAVKANKLALQPTPDLFQEAGLTAFVVEPENQNASAPARKRHRK